MCVCVCVCREQKTFINKDSVVNMGQVFSLVVSGFVPADHPGRVFTIVIHSHSNALAPFPSLARSSSLQRYLHCIYSVCVRVIRELRFPRVTPGQSIFFYERIQNGALRDSWGKFTVLTLYARLDQERRHDHLLTRLERFLEEQYAC